VERVITNLQFLDWLLVSVSLFNAILLLWLALTIVLNAERRTWGLWLIEAGLLLGSLFFISHTIIIGHEMTIFGSQDLEGWWKAGWVPVILAPYVWYVMILWYTGVWEKTPHRSPGARRARQRHSVGVILMGGYALGLLIVLVVARPLPTYQQLTVLRFYNTTTLGGYPLMFVLYPPLALACVLLPLDALRYPTPSQRLMGELARQRARPWLAGASAAMLIVALLLTAFLVWVGFRSQTRLPRISPSEMLGMDVYQLVALFDLLLETLICGAILLLGQSIVSYEVFTGKVLPRRGFFRQWRSTILLAAVISGTVGLMLRLQPLPVFSLVLLTLVMIGLYALFGWRTFQHRETYMARLRPFVSSQQMVNALTHADDDSGQRAWPLFQAICQDVLETERAFLIPLGALSPLAGPPLAYPRRERLPDLRPLIGLFASPQAEIVTLDPAQYGGLAWGVALCSERGVIGALLLGPKLDRGLYTEEEIDIARASAERILDMLAGEQIARRLVEIQRRRLSETRVVDLRTRRALHDDILPTLHLAALKLSGLARTESAAQDVMQGLIETHQKISDLIHTPSGGASIPAAGDDLIGALRDLVQQDYAAAFNAIYWQADGDLPALDPLVAEVIIGAVREAVRNAAVHGRGEQAGRALNLWITLTRADRLRIAVRDDGVGLAYRSAAPRDLPSGSGGGLTLHSTMLAIIGGELAIDAPLDGGTRVTISAPG
jgi:signal transduction histidine kinase